MNEKKTSILGSPFLDLSSLLSCRGQPVSPSLDLATRAEEILSEESNHHFIVFWLPPDWTFAHLAKSAGSGTPQMPLAEFEQAWMDGTFALLNLRKRHPSAVLLIDLRELTQEKLQGSLLHLTGGMVDSVRSLSEPDSVLLSLCAEGMRRNRTLSAEMSAASCVLVENWTPPKVSLDQAILQLKVEREQAIQTHEMLLKEIHSAHLESEGFFEGWKRLELLGGNDVLQVERVERRPASRAGEHSDRDFVLHRARFAGRAWPAMEVRLVEHAGNPGLRLARAPGAPAPLLRWEPNESSGGREYMLLVPTDSPTRQTLFGSTASDLALVRGVAQVLAGDFLVHGQMSAEDRIWLAVARSFLATVDSIPERLHYDRVEASAEAGSWRSPVRIRLSPVYFHGRLFDQIQLVWHPGDRGGILSIESETDSEPCLFRWPTIGGRGVAKSVEINLQSRAGKKQLQPLWRRLPRSDRMLLLAIAKELSNFVHHLVQQAPSKKNEARRLSSSARTFSRNLRTLDRTERLFAFLKKAFK